MDEKFERILRLRQAQVEKFENRLEGIKEKLKGFSEGSRGYEVYSQQVRDTENNINRLKSAVEFLRPVDEADMASRVKILNEYPKRVKELFPDGFPIVFHGTNNIGTVREILKSGGLLTPEQRGVSFSSFATAIDVTYKDNIRVSCEFAEPGVDSHLPYGAIFAFKPQDDEIENVISTGDSSEVGNGGVNGVSFREEPERLFGVITTPENMERVIGWCKEYGIDPEKVFTHKLFLEHYGEKFKNAENYDE